MHILCKALSVKGSNVYVALVMRGFFIAHEILGTLSGLKF